MVKTSIPEHPLFPFEDDEEPKEIAFIQVIRHENGRSKQVPRMFRAEELRSLQDIFNLFGGGMYELWGRGRSISNPETCGRIAANRRYEIAGLSKPLVDDGSNVAQPVQPLAPPSTQAGAIVAPAGAGPDTSVMAMFMNMQMQMAQQSQEANRQMLTMMMTMLNTGKAESAQMMQMISQANAQQIQGMMGVLTAVISKTGGDGGGPDAMEKYVSLFSKMGIMAKAEGAAEAAESGGIGSILGDLADVIQGAVQLKEGGLLGASAPPPGSAAALMGTSPFKIPPGGGQVPPVAT